VQWSVIYLTVKRVLVIQRLYSVRFDETKGLLESGVKELRTELERERIDKEGIRKEKGLSHSRRSM
jgi:hypothetical protein